MYLCMNYLQFIIVYVCIYLFCMDRPRPGEGLQEQIFKMDVEDEVDCGNQVPHFIF